MSTVDKAVEAGARTLYEPGGFIHHRYCVDVPTGEVFCSCGWQASGPEAIAEYDEHEARVVIAAAWPILSEPLRGMHTEREWRPLDGTYLGGTVCDHCRRGWPCQTMRAIHETDRALGIGEGEASC